KFLFQAMQQIAEQNVSYVFIFCCYEIHDKELLQLLCEFEEESCLQAKRFKNILCITSKEIIEKYPTHSIYDEITNKLGGIPYTQEFYAALALTTIRTVHAIKRKPYKIIIVDCDNTLWDGVCGEV